MNDAFLGFVVGLVSGVILVICMEVFVKQPLDKRQWEQEAVDNQAAEWIVNQKNGGIEFKWKKELKIED